VTITPTASISVAGETTLKLSAAHTNSHVVYASVAGGAATAAPVIGSTRVSATYGTLVDATGVGVAVTAGQHISVIEVDASDKVVGYTDYTISAPAIGALASSTGITEGVTITPTASISVAGETTLKLSAAHTNSHVVYASVAGGAATAAPFVGSTRVSATYGTLVDATGVGVAVTAGQHISVIEVEAADKVVGYTDYTISAPAIGALADATGITTIDLATSSLSGGITTVSFSGLAASHEIYASASGVLATAAPVLGSIRVGTTYGTLVNSGDTLPSTATEHISFIEVDGSGNVIGYIDLVIS
jgi:hypothetical protein